jgi:hypothetical protein
VKTGLGCTKRRVELPPSQTTHALSRPSAPRFRVILGSDCLALSRVRLAHSLFWLVQVPFCLSRAPVCLAQSSFRDPHGEICLPQHLALQGLFPFRVTDSTVQLSECRVRVNSQSVCLKGTETRLKAGTTRLNGTETLLKSGATARKAGLRSRQLPCFNASVLLVSPTGTWYSQTVRSTHASIRTS